MKTQERNISADEIRKFDGFSSDWWDPDGRMKSLHDINPLRLRYVLSRTSLKGKRVLDVGCGGGILSEEISRQGATVTGIDASSEMIAIARDHARMSNLDIDYQVSDIESLSLNQRYRYDVVLVMELLEHVPDPGSVVRACRRLIEPEGLVIAATINRNILSFWLAIVCAEYILGLLPKGTHTYRDFIRPSELEDICRDAGLALEDITGFSYNPVTRDYYLCRNSLVNYLADFRPVT